MLEWFPLIHMLDMSVQRSEFALTQSRSKPCQSFVWSSNKCFCQNDEHVVQFSVSSWAHNYFEHWSECPIGVVEIPSTGYSSSFSYSIVCSFISCYVRTSMKNSQSRNKENLQYDRAIRHRLQTSLKRIGQLLAQGLETPQAYTVLQIRQCTITILSRRISHKGRHMTPCSELSGHYYSSANLSLKSWKWTPTYRMIILIFQHSIQGETIYKQLSSRETARSLIRFRLTCSVIRKIMHKIAFLGHPMGAYALYLKVLTQRNVVAE